VSISASQAPEQVRQAAACARNAADKAEGAQAQAPERARQAAAQADQTAEQAHQAAAQARQAAAQADQTAEQARQAITQAASWQARRDAGQAYRAARNQAMQARQAAAQADQAAELARQAATHTHQATEQADQTATHTSQAAGQAGQAAERADRVAEDAEYTALAQNATEADQEALKQVTAKRKAYTDEDALVRLISNLTGVESLTRRRIKAAAKTCLQGDGRRVVRNKEKITALQMAIRDWSDSADNNTWWLIRAQLWFFLLGSSLIAAISIWTFLTTK